ncbi:MAG: DUF2059 domain-containing protein [Paludibacter sp.]|nr:DUF2059 domain-containing protein [Paludibacter sp.]
MKKLIFLFLFSVCFLSTTFAQTTKQKSIKELFIVMRNDSMMNKMLDSMVPAMANQMNSQANDSLARAKSVDIMNVSMQAVKVLIPQMMDDMALIYDKYFTEKEINDFIVFYKSPSGQKYLSQTPEIMKEFMGTMMQKYVPEMQKAMKLKFEELKKSDKI